MRRLRKEFKLNIRDNVMVKYGTVNKDNPRVIYVNGKCWLTQADTIDFKNELSHVENEMRELLKEMLSYSSDFERKFILGFDINTEHTFVGCQKFLIFDFYLKQKDNDVKGIRDIKPYVEPKANRFVNELVTSLNNHGFTVANHKI